ncbi:MAG: hypothetical protein TREMPRED_002781 [Tremellales sp. Tagirdzhanova-0007]|nr:MAG: hypothetical protein TREMPRED_002781 [Tremellales sp. Tagirdzhanova-0007]
MAASARAARKTEQDKARGSSNGDGEYVEIPVTKKKRFVRRRSLWERVMSLPQVIIDKVLLEYPTSFESILPPSHLANPISLGIHALHYLFLAPLFAASHESGSVLRSGKEQTGVNNRWDRWEADRHVKGEGLGGAMTRFTITLFFFTLAAANAIYLFTRFKKYDMQLRSEPVHSPHASPISAPRAKSTDGDVFIASSSNDNHPRPVNVAGHVLVAIIKWTFAAFMSLVGRPLRSTIPGAFVPSEDKIQSLRVWEPSEFCLAFFCAFPPSAPILSYLLTHLHPFLTPLLHLCISALLLHLATSYAQLVKDRMILSAEVMREYDRRFVYKRIFGARVDRGVGTHEAESLW